jgi:hypothetical protein
MLYCLYPEDILKRKEAEKVLTMEDLVIEFNLRKYSDWSTEKRIEMRMKDNKSNG